MKDSYTFDMDAAGLDAAYEKHYQAYTRIFERCGLNAIAVEAHSGRWAAASRTSSWFRPAPARTCGHLRQCGYHANLEKAVSIPVTPAVPDPEGDLAAEKFHTPGRKTILECRSSPSFLPPPR